MNAPKIKTYVGRFTGEAGEKMYLNDEYQLFYYEGIEFGVVEANVLYDTKGAMIGTIGKMQDFGVHESAPYTMINGGSGRFENMNGAITLPEPKPKPNIMPPMGNPMGFYTPAGDVKKDIIIGLLEEIRDNTAVLIGIE